MLDDGGGGGGAFDQFANLAQSGGFAISASGGEALLQAIRALRDWIDEQGFTATQLTVQPKLGTSNGAEIMKPYMVSVATDEEGFIPVLAKLSDSLLKAEDAIGAAMSNYGAADEDGVITT